MDKENLDKLINDIIIKWDITLKNNNKKYDFAELTLASGLPGIILLLSELEDVSDRKKISEKIDEYLEYIVSKIGTFGLFTASLYSGASGIALIIYHLRNTMPKYSNLIESLNKYIDYYVREKISKIDLEEITPPDYDVIEGLAGVLSYLFMVDNGKYDELKNLIVDFLSNLVSDRNNLIIYVKSENQMSEAESDMYPLGCLNLGFAHGLAGIGSILAYAQAKGFSSRLSRIAIKNIVSIYEEFELTEEGEYLWKDGIVIDELREGKNLREASFIRDAWCYGSPGISLFYLYAGLIENNDYLINKSEKILQSAMKRRLGVSSEMICHGNSGLIQICLLFETLLGTSSFDFYIKDFKNEFEIFYQEYKESGDTGFLEGVSGSLLTYLDVNGVENYTYWHRALLIFDDFLQ